MTSTQMDDLLTLYVGSRPDATAARRILFLNEAQKSIALSFFFDELETISESVVTTDEQETDSPPAGDYHIETIHNYTSADDISEPLEQKDWDWFNEHHSALVEAKGRPLRWCLHEGIIYWDPIPDDAYTMRIAGRDLPVAMVVGSVNCELPEDWHMLLVKRAAADMLFMFGNDTRAMTLKNEYLADVATRQEKRTLRRRRQHGQLQPMVRKPH